jgi:hypothetical protein
MAKANVNTASREELVEAGIRAEIADEILELRRKGKIAGPEALEQVPGVGPATLEQLRRALGFGEPAKGSSGGDRGQERERGGGRGGEEAAEAAGEVQRELAQRSAEGTAELGQALVDLVQEQARHNLETLKALAEAVDWERCFQLQAEYLGASLERAARLNRRYLEATRAVMTAAVDTTRDQAKKAA